MASQTPGHAGEKVSEVDRDVAAPKTNGSSSESAVSDDGNAVQSHGAAPAGVSPQSDEKNVGDSAGEDEAPEASRTKLQTFLIMFALCSGLFLAALDITIVATAVPTIVAEFNSSQGKFCLLSSRVSRRKPVKAGNTANGFQGILGLARLTRWQTRLRCHHGGKSAISGAGNPYY